MTKLEEAIDLMINSVSRDCGIVYDQSPDGFTFTFLQDTSRYKVTIVESDKTRNPTDEEKVQMIVDESGKEIIQEVRA